jgi:hypothetical protein
MIYMLIVSIILVFYLKHGNTPLSWASYWGLTDICDLLLDRGADINTQSNVRSMLFQATITVLSFIIMIYRWELHR